MALAEALCAGTGAEMTLDDTVAEEADLIVSQVLHPEAPAALALAPLGLAEVAVPLGRIAVGHDGSREGARALALGERLAVGLGAALTIVAVDEAEAGSEEQRLRRRLERSVSAASPRLSVESRLLRGPADLRLAEAAMDADLLVLGSRSRFGGAPRMRSGTTAAAVARLAPRPLVIATA